MRRLIAVAAFSLFLAVPVWAQHGGGFHGGGGGGGHASFGGGGHSGGFGHSGFSGSHGISHGSSPSVHAYSGIRSQARGPVSRVFSAPSSSRFASSHFSSGRTFTARAGFSHGPFLHDGFRNRGVGFRDFRFRNNCFGFACRGNGWPWLYSYWDPWWWWNSDSDYDQSYDDNLALAQQMDAQNLEEQRMLRQEEADADQDAYARQSPAPREEKEAQGTPIIPATVLVFRDQHRQEVDNYAIVGQTVWVFAPRQAQKIALADLDLTATVKANEDRGASFRLPDANEAQ